LGSSTDALDRWTEAATSWGASGRTVASTCCAHWRTLPSAVATLASGRSGVALPSGPSDDETSLSSACLEGPATGSLATCLPLDLGLMGVSSS